jgi:hypothetical protein
VNTRPAALAVPLAAGAATALALGLYASLHDATGRDFVVTGFRSSAAWKSAFASVTVFLFLMQMSLGLRITGRIGPRRPPPSWATDVHRLIGTIAFGISIPVVFHCIWTLGYVTTDSRVATHSLLGCLAYGAYVANVLSARADDELRWAWPGLGVVLGVLMTVVWWSSALVYYAGSSS